MILHYAGRYDGKEEHLPQKEHHPSAVPFQEAEDMKKVSLIANLGCIGVMLILAIPFLILGMKNIPDHPISMMIGGLCGGISIVPHELLHAICYRGDVFLYHDLSHGLMFVVGTEDMSRRHFVLTCLCPNIVLGFIPYITFLLFPDIVGLGLFGIINIGMGFGDWINVYHAVKQMPRNAKTYLCGMHSYWYVEQGV